MPLQAMYRPRVSSSEHAAFDFSRQVLLFRLEPSCLCPGERMRQSNGLGLGLGPGSRQQRISIRDQRLDGDDTEKREWLPLPHSVRRLLPQGHHCFLVVLLVREVRQAQKYHLVPE